MSTSKRKGTLLDDLQIAGQLKNDNPRATL